MNDDEVSPVPERWIFIRLSIAWVAAVLALSLLAYPGTGLLIGAALLLMFWMVLGAAGIFALIRREMWSLIPLGVFFLMGWWPVSATPALIGREMWSLIALGMFFLFCAASIFSFRRQDAETRRHNFEVLCADRGIAMKPSGKNLDLLPGEWERIEGPMERLKSAVRELVPGMIAWIIMAISFAIVGAILYWFDPLHFHPILLFLGGMAVAGFIGGALYGDDGPEPEYGHETLREVPLLRPEARPAITSSPTPGLDYRPGAQPSITDLAGSRADLSKAWSPIARERSVK